MLVKQWNLQILLCVFGMETETQRQKLRRRCRLCTKWPVEIKIQQARRAGHAVQQQQKQEDNVLCLEFQQNGRCMPPAVHQDS